MLLCCWVAVTSAATARVCPDIAAAAKALRLDVSAAPVNLPNGKQMKEGLVYNGSFIGPLITAALGEEISVDVANMAPVGTSVHWHGMDLPDAAWADGVDGVTQQPIPPGETFRYKFKAGPAGTLWYHSHVGMQFADGLRGPLIVTDPNDPYKAAYDEEVVLLLTDQNAQSGEEELRALQDGTASMAMGTCTDVSNQDWSDAPFTTILTNGKGFMQDPATKKPVGSPHVIKVQQGKRYRFRAIQGAASWGLKVKVQGHGIQVIALDGSNVQPTPAQGFVFTPGERVDFILHANQKPGNYWIDIATLTGNNSPALLSYVGADEKVAGPPQLSMGCNWALYDPDVLDFKNVTLKPHASVPAPPPKADATLALYLINSANPDQSKQAVLGSKSVLGMPKTPQPQNGCRKLPDGRESRYCWSQNWVEFSGAKNGVPLLFPDMQPGAQTYIQEVPFGAVIDVVIINPGTMLHPMHLHGQRFWVLGAGNGQILTPDGKVDYSKLNSQRAIMRDTQPVANAIPAATAAKAPAAPAARGVVEAMPGTADKPDTRSKMTNMGRKLRQSMNGMPGMDSMPAKPAAATAAKPESMAGMAGMPAKPAAAATKASQGSMAGMAAAALTPGYAVIRFKATNPGMWAFHCHIDLHANSGMMMAFKVAAPPAAAAARQAQPWSLPKGVTACGQDKPASSAMAMAVDSMQQASGKAPMP